MTAVDIEYCVPCGMLDRAQTVQYELLDRFGQELERASLVTGDDGVFTVDVDGERVFDKEEDEYDVDEITRRVRDHL